MSDVLPIIDVQNAILDGTASDERINAVTTYLNEVVERLADLKATATSKRIPTILVQNDGPDGHRLAVNSKGWEIRPELAPTQNDIVVHKVSNDSFHDTDLMKHLKRIGASRLIIGGCMTQFCVDTAVRRAVSSGFDVVLVSDGHCTGDSGVLKQNEIIAHHNKTLDGFNAGENLVSVVPSAKLSFRS